MHRLISPLPQLLILLLLFGGCAPAKPDPELPTSPPYIRGVITAIDGSQIRVEQNPTSSTGAAKAVLRLTPETQILWRSGEVADRRDLRLGARVSAWVVGPLLESYPVQGTASTVMIESTTEPAVPQA